MPALALADDTGSTLGLPVSKLAVQYLGHDVALEVVIDGRGEELGLRHLLGVVGHEPLQALGLGRDGGLGGSGTGSGSARRA